MAKRKNLRDGYQQAIRETGIPEETRIAVEVEGATFEVPGGLNVHLEHDGAAPDSVQIGDGTDLLDINVDGSLNVNVISSANTTATIFNVAVATSGTEVSQALPANTKRFILRSRNRSEIQLAYISGNSGTLYLTISPGATYEDSSFYTGQTLYFQTSKNAETVEIIAFT
jgi:hypothetical protein